jgi:hypothetical protein
MARRRLDGFFDFRNFSDLQGFADRDRTTAERDRKAEEMTWYSRQPQPCRRKESQTSMSTVRVVVIFKSSLCDRATGRSRQRSANQPWAEVL